MCELPKKELKIIILRRLCKIQEKTDSQFKDMTKIICDLINKSIIICKTRATAFDIDPGKNLEFGGKAVLCLKS